jgi:hypothetical protein
MFKSQFSNKSQVTISEITNQKNCDILYGSFGTNDEAIPLLFRRLLRQKKPRNDNKFLN